MKKLIAAVALIATLVVSPQPAEAANFSGCQWQKGWAARSAGVLCWYDGGQYWASYRIRLTCSYAHGGNYYSYGPWRSAGTWSNADCGGVGPYSARVMQTTG